MTCYCEFTIVINYNLIDLSYFEININYSQYTSHMEVYWRLLQTQLSQPFNKRFPLFILSDNYESLYLA